MTNIAIKRIDKNLGQNCFYRKRMLLRNAHWILLAVCVFLVYIIYSASDEQPPSLDADIVTAAAEAKRSPLIVNVKNRTRLKSILYWNEFYGRYDTFDFGFGNEPFHENGCQYTNCFATKVGTISGLFLKKKCQLSLWVLLF